MNEPEQPRKLPEFIILDDESEGEGPAGSYSRIQEPPLKKPSWKMRLLFVVISFVAFMWTFGAFFFTLCAGILTLLTFFKVPLFCNLTKLYWAWTRGGTIVTLGFFVAVFNFSLGVIIMLYYFSHTQENWQKGVVERVVNLSQ